jgi:hypothetical protein
VPVRNALFTEAKKITSPSEVESLLEISQGKGANSTTFDTPTSNLAVAENGATTSGGATQFQLQQAAPIDPTKFVKTPRPQ